MMPGDGMTGLGLATPAMNTAAIQRHPIQKSTKTMIEQESLSNFDLARKHQGRGFAVELQMEQLMCAARPRVPNRSMATLGASILAGRQDRIVLEDYVGETEGRESLREFAYPI